SEIQLAVLLENARAGKRLLRTLQPVVYTQAFEHQYLPTRPQQVRGRDAARQPGETELRISSGMHGARSDAVRKCWSALVLVQVRQRRSVGRGDMGRRYVRPRQVSCQAVGPRVRRQDSARSAFLLG